MQVLAAVAVMVAGALVAAASDLSFNVYGYAAVIVNDLFSAAYLVMLKHFGPAKGVDSSSLLAYNSLLSLAPLVLASWGLGEAHRIAAFDVGDDWRFKATAAAAVALGLTINHSTYVCTRVNEPLTTSVAGGFKNILMTGIGMLAFGDYVFAWANVCGIALSMAGAVWYAIHGALQAMQT